MLKRNFLIFLILVFCVSVVTFTNKAYAQSETSPAVVFKKVTSAAAYLAKHGKAGLSKFNDKNSKWVWKDTYVFVMNCSKGITVAHVNPRVIGLPIEKMKDRKGNPFGFMICKASKEKKGKWIEYWWVKPGQKKFERKVSFCIKVKNQPFQVGAGIYNKSYSIKELNKKFR